jgi:hypothetical protein
VVEQRLVSVPGEHRTPVHQFKLALSASMRDDSSKTGSRLLRPLDDDLVLRLDHFLELLCKSVLELRDVEVLLVQLIDELLREFDLRLLEFGRLRASASSVSMSRIS